jgi:hypothetical protein
LAETVMSPERTGGCSNLLFACKGEQTNPDIARSLIASQDSV